jgi:hypothetical protein
LAEQGASLLLGGVLVIGGGVLIAAGYTGSSLASVVQGKPDRAKAAAAATASPSSGSSSPPASAVNAATGASAVPSGAFANQQSFAKALLTGLGAPLTAGNVSAVTAWVDEEGGNWKNQAAYNPLNTTLKLPGASYFESTGPGAAPIAIYTSPQQGYSATLQTLQGYPSIVGALQRGVSGPSELSSIVSASPWGSGPF